MAISQELICHMGASSFTSHQTEINESAVIMRATDCTQFLMMTTKAQVDAGSLVLNSCLRIQAMIRVSWAGIEPLWPRLLEPNMLRAKPARHQHIQFTADAGLTLHIAGQSGERGA